MFGRKNPPADDQAPIGAQLACIPPGMGATLLVEGNNWIDANAGTAEAIDFYEHYVREALRWNKNG